MMRLLLTAVGIDGLTLHLTVPFPEQTTSVVLGLLHSGGQKVFFEGAGRVLA